MNQNAEIINQAIANSLNILEQDREREIINRRFGLTEEKETLEQIGKALGITRERVRQLEKSILAHLKLVIGDQQNSALSSAEKTITRALIENGNIARIDDLAKTLYGHAATAVERAQFIFIGEISPAFTLINENDYFYPSIGIADHGDANTIINRAKEIVTTIKKNGSVMTLSELDKVLDYSHPIYIKAIASLSKDLAHIDDLWGLSTWPEVNPRNIRDKIYLILDRNKQPMHFSEIANAIAKSDFKHKNVTVPAVHNELIKDDRFVLIGRGTYALSKWGYRQGTVADVIKQILTDAKEPMTKNEIIKEVLKSRKVKDATIALGLQNKKLFKKVGKNSYTLA